MKIAVIGGGFTGMTVAFRLSEKGHFVKLFEQELQLGGLATFYDYGSFFWDKFYHVILPSDKYLIDFIDDLELGDKIQWNRTYTGYYVNENFYSVSSTKEFLAFPPLGFIDKLRLGFTIYYGSKIKDWKKLEKISVKNWLVKVGGKSNFENFWKPLLLAKLGSSYHNVSAVFIWTYIKRLFEARQSSAKKEYMGYVEGGYKTIITKTEEHIRNFGSEIHSGVTINCIDLNLENQLILNYNNIDEQYDKIIFTGPVSALNKVVSPKIADVQKGVKEVEYLGVICLVLITSRPLMNYYVLNVADERLPFTGVIGMSSIVDNEETDGKYLTYFPKYISSGDELLRRPEKELKKTFLQGVESLFPEIKKIEIYGAEIHKAFKVQPLQVIDYSLIVPEITTKHPGFFVLNTAQFVNSTLNNNAVVNHVNQFVRNKIDF